MSELFWLISSTSPCACMSKLSRRVFGVVCVALRKQFPSLIRSCVAPYSRKRGCWRGRCRRRRRSRFPSLTQPGVELLDAGAVCPLIVVFLFERYFSTCIFGSAEFCLHGLSHGPRPRFVKEGRESECSRELLLVACNGGPCAFDTMLQFRLQRLFESDNIYQLAVPS